MRGSTHTLLMDKRPFHPPTFFMITLLRNESQP